MTSSVAAAAAALLRPATAAAAAAPGSRPRTSAVAVHSPTLLSYATDMAEARDRSDTAVEQVSGRTAWPWFIPAALAFGLDATAPTTPWPAQQRALEALAAGLEPGQAGNTPADSEAWDLLWVGSLSRALDLAVYLD